VLERRDGLLRHVHPLHAQKFFSERDRHARVQGQGDAGRHLLEDLSENLGRHELQRGVGGLKGDQEVLQMLVHTLSPITPDIHARAVHHYAAEARQEQGVVSRVGN
jgi:hypothetical protein